MVKMMSAEIESIEHELEQAIIALESQAFVSRLKDKLLLDF